MTANLLLMKGLKGGITNKELEIFDNVPNGEDQLFLKFQRLSVLPISMCCLDNSFYLVF